MEEWKPVVGYEWLYEVSSLGKIKSLRYWKEKFIKWWILKFWHLSTRLYWNWIVFSTSFHRLVAFHFIPNPLNLPCVLHRKEDLDENWALYNWADNLFWWTHKDNIRDMWNKWRQKNTFQTNHPKIWKWKFWKDHNASKSVNQYTLKWEFIKEWESILNVERSIWINHRNISSCCLLKRKSAWWYIWKYKNK